MIFKRFNTEIRENNPREILKEIPGEDREEIPIYKIL